MSKSSEHAYRIVRAGILDGSLAPGSQLTEEDIAALCGVSRTPVRVAMQRLEAEMFLARSDSNRTFVSNWSANAIEDLFMLRTMLEAHVAERAARVMTDDTIARLKTSSAASRKGIDLPVPDVDVFLHENFVFHRLILEATGSELLVTMMSRLVLVPVIHQTAQRYSRQQLEQSQTDHEEIIAAFEAHDPTWAGAIMTSHIRRARNAYFGTATHPPAPYL
ncbi:GntR family transcriptional regulator [Sphingosinicellaceae bacterium]|nr:GntR family transcriptional regulator [Sphingosinicellaceae bacterium]